MKKRIIQFITLFLFVTLISAFVIYRSNWIPSKITIDPNVPSDSLPSKNLVKKKGIHEILPSSKTIIMPPLKITDSLKVRNELDSTKNK